MNALAAVLSGTGITLSPDADGDSIRDTCDNCPSVANGVGQAFTVGVGNQSDFDIDRIGDACDPDKDGDGIVDYLDNCPAAPNPSQTNTDGDALGDMCDPDDDNDGFADTFEISFGTNPLNPDTDGDGVIDGADNCPLMPNPNQADTNGNGIGDACDVPDVPFNICIQACRDERDTCIAEATGGPERGQCVQQYLTCIAGC